MCDDETSRTPVDPAPEPAVAPAVARRSLLTGGASLVLVGCAGKTQKWEVEDVVVDGGVIELDLQEHAPLVTPGGMKAIRADGKGKPILVMRMEKDQFTVLSLKCTHLGCTVRWDNEEQQLRCPCHGSRYDDTGRVTKGPAKSRLRELESRLLGTKLSIRIPEDL